MGMRRSNECCTGIVVTHKHTRVAEKLRARQQQPKMCARSGELQLEWRALGHVRVLEAESAHERLANCAAIETRICGLFGDGEGAIRERRVREDKEQGDDKRGTLSNDFATQPMQCCFKISHKDRPKEHTQRTHTTRETKKASAHPSNTQSIACSHRKKKHASFPQHAWKRATRMTRTPRKRCSNNERRSVRPLHPLPRTHTSCPACQTPCARASSCPSSSCALPPGSAPAPGACACDDAHDDDDGGAVSESLMQVVLAMLAQVQVRVPVRTRGRASPRGAACGSSWKQQEKRKEKRIMARQIFRVRHACSLLFARACFYAFLCSLRRVSNRFFAAPLRALSRD